MIIVRIQKISVMITQLVRWKSIERNTVNPTVDENRRVCKTKTLRGDLPVIYKRELASLLSRDSCAIRVQKKKNNTVYNSLFITTRLMKIDLL
jgi:hypothetical protein